jgi:hypothetical protein
MLGFTTKSPDRAAAVARVRGWTKARFALTDDDTLMVSELACRIPGCPPIETHDDLPPAFMKNALVALEGFECDCC